MTIRRQEFLEVRAVDDDPQAMIAALSELPEGVRLVQVEHDDELCNRMGHRFGTRPVTFTFKREVTDG